MMAINKFNSDQALQVADGRHSVCVRVKLFIPQQRQQALILDQLMQDYGLSIHLFCSVLELNNKLNQLDLELQGTIAQINSSLAYLTSLNIKIKGKPNPDGDSWYY